MNNCFRKGILAAAIAGVWISLPSIVLSSSSLTTRELLRQRALLVGLYGPSAAAQISSLGDALACSVLASLLLAPVLAVAGIAVCPQLDIRRFNSLVPKLATIVLVYVLCTHLPSWILEGRTVGGLGLIRMRIVLGTSLALTSLAMLLVLVGASFKFRLVRIFVSTLTGVSLSLLAWTRWGVGVAWLVPNKQIELALSEAQGARLWAYLCLIAQIGLWLASAWLYSFRLRRAALIGK